MVIDTSAVLAILLNEPERREFNEAIEAAESIGISATTFVETSIVVEARFGSDGLRDLDLFLNLAKIELVDVDVEQDTPRGKRSASLGKDVTPQG